MKDVAERIRQKFRRFYANTPLPCRCPHCGSSRVGCKDNSVLRSASFLVDGEVVYVSDLPGLRVQCHDCGQSWRHRPPGLMPRRHYQLCVVAEGVGAYLFEEGATLSEVARHSHCSRWTVANWLRWLGRIATPADLQARLVELSDTVVLAPLRKVAGLARKASDAAEAIALELAAEVLGLLECLGLAAGLEPPGLRAVVEAVVDNRDRVTTYAAPALPEFSHIGLAGRL
ncbi:MAG: hypothetical protein QME96_08075 [Myxococcota bacterium]|nr:hypothetical protein [Myxococcota bacterium]